MGRAGIGRTAQELARALAAELQEDEELALFGVALAGPRKLAPDVQWALETPRVRLARARFPNRLLSLLGRLGWMGVETFTGPLDFYLAADFVYPPLRSAGLVPLIFDLLFLREGAGYHSREFCERIGRRVAAALARSRAVIVPSRAVASDLERFFPDLAIPRRVIPLGKRPRPHDRSLP